MKKILLLATITSTLSYAHQPYLAPLAYVTENTQIPIIAGYAENAFNSEYALKDASFSIIDPTQSITTIKAENILKSSTVFDLSLPIDGTYQISSHVNYPLKYALHNKQWKLYYETSLDKAGELVKRDYLIPDDFKSTKAPKITEVTRQWTIESYISKNKVSAIQNKKDAALNVSFSTHPNEIIVGQPIHIQVTKAGKHLTNAEVNIVAQGQNTENQAIKTPTNNQGVAEHKFTKSGQYLIEVTETVNLKQQPRDQHYTIVSLLVKDKTE